MSLHAREEVEDKDEKKKGSEPNKETVLCIRAQTSLVIHRDGTEGQTE